MSGTHWVNSDPLERLLKTFLFMGNRELVVGWHFVIFLESLCDFPGVAL